jgi:hypothetical protein
MVPLTIIIRLENSARLMKRLALPRQKAVDFTKPARGVLKTSMKLVQQR